MISQSIGSLAETIYYITSSIGLILGGIWVYWKFVYQRVGNWNLKIKYYYNRFDNENGFLEGYRNKEQVLSDLDSYFVAKKIIVSWVICK